MVSKRQIDNRWSPRQQVTLDITLHASGQFPFSGVVRNVSLGGLFVEADTTRLPGDAEVYVAFALRTNTGTQYHRMPARNIRQNGNGAALLFTALDTRVIHDLRRLLYPVPALAPAPAFNHATVLRPAG